MIKQATPAPPTSDSPVSDFGGITGLTCTKIASNASALSNTNTNQTVTLTSGVYYNFTAKVVWNMLGGSGVGSDLRMVDIEWVLIEPIAV